MRIYLLIAIIVIVTSSCVRKNNTNNQAEVLNDRRFEVSEVIQASSYTYLKVNEGSEEKWMAITKQNVQPGEFLYYDEALQMTNFHSKDLDRTFDVIYFVNQVSNTPVFNHPAAVMPGSGGMEGTTGNMHSGKIEPGKKSQISVNKKEGEYTIASVYEMRNQLADKEIEIRGQVVKVNRQIMGKNWVHIQDGTENKGKYDLTITTQEPADIGDEVTFKGRISVDKDFGSGYYYELIMEDAHLLTDN